MPFRANQKQEQRTDQEPAEGQKNEHLPPVATKQQPAEQKQQKERTDGLVTKIHQCPQCDYTCPKVSNIKRHMKRKHSMNGGNLTFQNGKCLCLECDQHFYQIKHLREHLSTVHGLFFKTETIHMQNVKEFESWKADLEEKEGCSFVKVTGSKKHLSTGQKVEYLQCNRCGTYRPRKNGKRRQKSQGTCKIERNCTSTMVLKYGDDETVTVDVCFTHYGHEKELQHVWLSKAKRQQLAAKIQQGVPRERILNDIRESVTENQLTREHLVENKDLFNIQIAFGLKDFQRHQNDLDSVLAWMSEWEQLPEANPVLFHKFQGEIMEGYDLAKEDILIVVQSPFQKRMLEKFGPNGVCCDSTHGTNGYDFLLTTLLVIDEYGEGFPAAWCISNHEDFTTMCIFFREVKKNTGTIKATWFMSDIAPQFYNAWVGVMNDSPRPRKLLCTWHVDRAITCELRKKIGDMVTENEVYKMFRTVLEQTSEKLFHDSLQGFLRRLSLSSKTASFKKYFEHEWVSRKQEWAYCFRVGLGINTNMFVEAFHKVFKYQYLKGKSNKRLDNCLLKLLKYVRDKTFDRVINLTKGKVTSRIGMINERHFRSLSLPTASVKAEDNNTWEVLGEDGKTTYKVSRLLITCEDQENCQLTCPECRICVHLYVCNCPDSLITSTNCKHIHLVCRSNLNNPQDEYINPLGIDEAADEVEKENNHEHCEKTLDLNFLRDCLKQTPNQERTSVREQRKKSITGKLLSIITEVEGCENDNALQQLEKSITSAHSLFTSIRDHGDQQLPTPKDNVPHNKNIVPQKRFFSTKKKTRKSNVRLAKSSKEEKVKILATWGEDKSLNDTTEVAPEDINAEEIQEMINWFCKKPTHAIQDLEIPDIKLRPSDLVGTSQVLSLPGEAVDADLTVLRKFFTDDAWNRLLELVGQLKKAWLCHLCQKSRYTDMIQCESCLHWFDWECANVHDEPEEWICRNCEASFPPKKSPRLETSI